MDPHRPVARLSATFALAIFVLSLGWPAVVAAAPASHSAWGTDRIPVRPYPALSVRKDAKDLTARERREFVEAVLALKTVPSPYDPRFNYYDQFVAWHLDLYPCGMSHEMIRAHAGPMFLPWHRLFLLRFENALREVSRKPITVPYWDWTDPSSTAAVFSDDFMGGDGDPDEGFAVTTGPFAKGDWELKVDPIGFQWTASATSYLTRHFGSFPGFTQLPTPEDVAFVQERPRYDVAPYDSTSDPNLSFRNALEGFWQNVGGARVASGSMACGPDGVMTSVSGPGPHNLVHVWAGGIIDPGVDGPRFGTMMLPSSPNDPVFFLHHANIDRLWAEWQEMHGIDSYEPDDCAQGLFDLGCTSNTETDPMHPPFDATPADVADITALGYRYDTTGGTPGTGAAVAASTSGHTAASSPGADRRASNGLVLFEASPNIAEFFLDEESMGPNAPLYDIWTVDPLGGVPLNLTNVPGVDKEGAWSPDGTLIAFASNRDGSDELDFEIYVMDADGTSVKQLTDRGWPYARGPTWSPDGRRIAFARGSELWMMRADGSREQMVFRDPSNRDVLLSDWSRDGRSLLFEMEGAHLEWDLWTVRPNGTGARRLVRGGGMWGASFSPDSKGVAFARATLCEAWCFFDLFVADRDGRNATNLTNTPNISEGNPTWSSDGTMIAFTGDAGIGRLDMDVWVIDAEGGVRRPLTVQPRTWDDHPDWQPVPAGRRASLPVHPV